MKNFKLILSLFAAVIVTVSVFASLSLAKYSGRTPNYKMSVSSDENFTTASFSITAKNSYYYFETSDVSSNNVLSLQEEDDIEIKVEENDIEENDVDDYSQEEKSDDASSDDTDLDETSLSF